MEAKKIDQINILLVIISFIIAIKIPFILLLFSYAVLGPLHYLTEIAWLNEKNYFFSQKKKWAIVFFVLAFLISLNPVINVLNLDLGASVKDALQFIATNSTVTLLVGFFFSIALFYFEKTKQLLLILLTITLLSYLAVNYFPDALLSVGIFLPTLVHVYFFTFLFVVYGALKSKSKYGLFLAILLCIVPLLVAYMPLDFTTYKPSEEIIDNFISSNLVFISSFIAKIFDKLQFGQFVILSDFGVRIQIFISFAYTYHYINWFSKTSIIGWKKSISNKNFIYIIILWIVSVSIYIYDYKTGLIALFFLSFLHVFVEFPLNIISIKGIYSLLKKK